MRSITWGVSSGDVVIGLFDFIDGCFLCLRLVSGSFRIDKLLLLVNSTGECCWVGGGHLISRLVNVGC